MECVYEYTEGRLCRGVALRLLLLLMAQMDLDVGHGIFNGRHCISALTDLISAGGYWGSTGLSRRRDARPAPARSAPSVLSSAA